MSEELFEKEKSFKEPTKKAKPKYKSAAGIDIGTMNIIAARLSTTDEITYTCMRDCFIELDLDKAKMLKLNKNVSYIEKEDRLVVLGEEAAQVANIFGYGLNRPLQSGVLSPSETDAMGILKIMLGTALGKPEKEGDVVYFSTPANPIDAAFDTVFHAAMLESLLEDLGWEATGVNEATALTFAEAAEEGFTSLSISMGSGMANIALVFNAIPIFEFSIAKGGDWIDKSVANVTGLTPERVCAIKEKGIDLMHPKTNVELALVTYYKHLIDLMIKTFIKKLKEVSNVELPSQIPLIVGGGTSLAKGVKELIEKSIKKNKGFPFEISEVRYASDQLNSVAKGLLIMAQNDGE